MLLPPVAAAGTTALRDLLRGLYIINPSSIITRPITCIVQHRGKTQTQAALLSSQASVGKLIFYYLDGVVEEQRIPGALAAFFSRI